MNNPENTRAGSKSHLERFQRKRRLALAVLFGAATFFLLFFQSQFGDGRLHEFIEDVGLALIGAAILGRLWSTLYIGGRKNADIVVYGPYSVTRNPLYLFSSIGAAGVGAQTGSIIIALSFGLATALAFQIVIRREEEFLRARFGTAYEAYCREVPRLLPRFSGFASGGPVMANPARLYSTLLDGLVFFAAVPAFALIELLQQDGILPVLYRMI